MVLAEMPILVNKAITAMKGQFTLFFFMSSDNLLYDNLFTVDILILIIYGYLSSLFLIYYIFPIVALLYYLNNLHM